MRKLFARLCCVSAAVALLLILLWNHVLLVWHDEKQQEKKLTKSAFEYEVKSNHSFNKATRTIKKKSVRSTALRTAQNTSYSSSYTKPRLTLHIGPHKTASSTIQCELTSLMETLHQNTTHEYAGRFYRECLCQEEQLVYAAIDTRSLVTCLDKHESSPCNATGAWKKLESTLKDLSKKRRDVFLSDEAFARIKATDSNLQLLSDTLSRLFRVQVVIVYRRYWDWLLSSHNEKYKPLIRRTKYLKWPGEGGEVMKTFSDFYQELSDQLREPNNRHDIPGSYQWNAEYRDLHPAQYLKNLFGQHFDDVIIFNMHQEGPLTTNFALQIFPDMEELLKKQNNHHQERPNLSMILDYDMLAVAARNHGLLRNQTLTRRQASFAVMNRLRNQPLNATTDLVCLTVEEEASLLNRSLFLEGHLFPDQSHDGLCLQHKLEFAKASQGSKFCNVDAAKVLADPSWQHFFQSL